MPLKNTPGPGHELSQIKNRVRKDFEDYSYLHDGRYHATLGRDL
jgi:hypothetical protein